jgi:hypothetical protein
METSTIFAVASRIQAFHGGSPEAAWDVAEQLLAGTNDLREIFIQCSYPAVADAVDAATAAHI